MDKYKDFTTGTDKFGDQAAMVDTLHSMGMHYVMIVVSTLRERERERIYCSHSVNKFLKKNFNL